MPLSASILLFINLFRSVRLPIFFVSQVVLTACYFCFAAFLTCFSPIIIQHPYSVRVQKHYSPLSCPRYASFLQTSSPGSSFPQVSLPRTSSPQASYPLFSYPRTSSPQASFPQTSFPQVSYPRTSSPQTSFPQVSLPGSSFPQISHLQVSLPGSSFPQISHLQLSDFFTEALVVFCPLSGDTGTGSRIFGPSLFRYRS